jgi:hypothetical protein
MSLIDLIIKASQQSDLVLLDANVFSEESQGDGLCEKLYDIRRPKNLEPLAEEISSLKEMWTWYHNNIIHNPKIKTTPLVLEEMKEFAEIITNCYEWHSGFYGVEPKKNKKINRREKILRTMAKERGVTHEDLPQVVRDLGTLSQLMHETIRDIRVYKGNTTEIPKKSNGASDADYELVEAAVGYVDSHPDNPDIQAEIISLDKHIPQIIQGYFKDEDRPLLEYVS